MAINTLSCYSGELDAYADLAGDFDFLSTQERDIWLARQWSQLATVGGWRAEFDATLAKLQQSQVGLVSLYSSALSAFTTFIRSQREDGGRSERASVRTQVILTLRTRSPAAQARARLAGHGSASSVLGLGPTRIQPSWTSCGILGR